MPLPDWIRIVLIVLSFISFLPQIHRIVSKKSSADISLTYILFNTISTTEQFTLGFFYIVNHADDLEFFVSIPRDLGDWLNLTQFTVVWLMSLVLFAVCIFYAPSSAPKARVVAIYVAFLLISVVPLFFSAKIPEQEKEGRMWFDAFFFFIHSTYINLTVTLGGIAALYFQWQKAAVLDLAGLAAQAVVFAAVALSWFARIRLDMGGEFGFSLLYLYTWFQMVGWAAVDNGVFALVQAVLFYLARPHQSGTQGEVEPLLGH